MDEHITSDQTALVRSLPDGPLDIVGDVHGEYQALLSLLGHLGYDAAGVHPDGRKLVFVGDLCDRGPDSVGVVLHVQKLVQSGHAFAVLGNHELNLLRGDAKDGSGWFFDERLEADRRYLPFTRPGPGEREKIIEFIKDLPLALERDDLRVVHAAWQPEEIEIARRVIGALAHHVYDQYQDQVDATLREDGRHQRYVSGL
jgi:hypothetical protein